MIARLRIGTAAGVGVWLFTAIALAVLRKKSRRDLFQLVFVVAH